MNCDECNEPAEFSFQRPMMVFYIVDGKRDTNHTVMLDDKDLQENHDFHVCDDLCEDCADTKYPNWKGMVFNKKGTNGELK